MDKALLLKKDRLGEDTHDIPGLGTVRFRALTRKEALGIRDKALPLDELERRVLALAMLDPVMTEEEVGEWQESSSAGEIEDIMVKITDMSGMATKAAREAYQSFRDEPGAGV